MTDFHVHLESDVATSFRAIRAAMSLDIDAKKKSVHDLTIDDADIDSPYNIGLIVGASGSGKTTLAQQIYGTDCMQTRLKMETPVIEQFPESYTYDECAAALAGVGLTSVPCWIRPAYTLSNGQRARAEAALQIAALSRDNGTIVLDEWTSVVDRTVARVMSHCIAKHARRTDTRVVICSCHYDVVDWLNPDWIIDANKQTFQNRRSLPAGERARKEHIVFTIRECDKRTWRYFSKYHYLSERLPGGKIYTYGLYCGDDQIGFQCFANYVPTPKRKHRSDIQKRAIFHSNRTVIHPDYAGLGMGMRLIDETSLHMLARPENYRIMAKFSSTPIYKAMSKDKFWKLCDVIRTIGKMHRGKALGRVTGFRENITTYSFEFIGTQQSA